MQTTMNDEQTMANVEGFRSPSWNTGNNMPPRTARTTESGSGGKLNPGFP